MHCLKFNQKLPLSLEQSWNFFSSPHNLKILTPDFLDIHIKHVPTCSEMYAGLIIAYTIRPFWNFPIEWVTEITHVQKPNYFIDEQRFGPYKFWHHEHHFYPLTHGIEMVDMIYYSLPFGFIGRALNYLKVQKDLEAIFNYRRNKLEELFGCYSKSDSKM